MRMRNTQGEFCDESSESGLCGWVGLRSPEDRPGGLSYKNENTQSKGPREWNEPNGLVRFRGGLSGVGLD